MLVGAKFTDTVTDLPAASVYGFVRPLTLYPAACTDFAEIVMAADPVFVTMRVCDRFAPTNTDPKFADVELNDNVACAALAERADISAKRHANTKCLRRSRQKVLNAW